MNNCHCGQIQGSISCVMQTYPFEAKSSFFEPVRVKLKSKLSSQTSTLSTKNRTQYNDSSHNDDRSTEPSGCPNTVSSKTESFRQFFFVSFSICHFSLKFFSIAAAAASTHPHSPPFLLKQLLPQSKVKTKKLMGLL